MRNETQILVFIILNVPQVEASHIIKKDKLSKRKTIKLSGSVEKC